MGSSVIAKCRCGYETEVSTGSGMMGPTPDYFPAHCGHCRAVVPADITAWPATCRTCGEEVQFYDAREFQMSPGSREVLDERTVTDPGVRHRLNDGAYLCPQCRQFALRFEVGRRLWD